jgi:Mg2+-importing ATPase
VGPLASEAAPTRDQGLTSTEAQQRLERFGPNLFRDDPRRPVVVQLLARFANPLILILLVASVVSAGVGDVTSFGLIVGLVLLSVLLDFSQEYRAQQTADKLRATVAVRATVLRDGVRCDVAVREVVPGDIFYLCAGDLIPADARVLDANDLFLNQAALTGEPYPIEKRPCELAASATEICDAANAVKRRQR